MNPLDYAQRHRKAILFLVAGLLVAGIGVTRLLPVSLFPDITFPRIVILADNGEQPAERMMIEVTKPLEEVASSVPGVELVRSITGRGSTEISLGLSWKTDVREALQTLQNRIGDIRTTLPADASIEVEQMSVAVFPILGYSLTSDSINAVDLRDLALYRIRPAITQVAGVARVEITGGETREFHIVASPEKLASYKMNIRDISSAVAKANGIASPGLVENNFHLYLSLVSGLLHSKEDIENAVVANRNGVPILVKDVASVEPSITPVYIRTTANGKPAVLINVVKQPTGSTVAIGDAVRKTVAKLDLPKGVEFVNWYDQGDFISRSIAGTRDSIVIGIVLSMFVLLIFLRSWRISLIMIIVVPATIALTLLVLYLIGQTINIMTLGGIAAAVGLIIDDSIVVIENIFVHLAHVHSDDLSARKTFFAAARRSVKGLFPAIVGSTGCTIVINVPLIFLGGLTGAFFAALAKTMILALGISFVLSTTVTPILVILLASRHGIEKELVRETRKSRMMAVYESVLRFLLRYRVAMIPIVLLIGIGTYMIYSRIGTGFMPDMDEGTFVLDYVSPPGTSLTETNAMLNRVGKELMKIPEVESYSRRTGTQLGFFLTEPNTGDFLVKLKTNRSRSIYSVIGDVRHVIDSTEPALQVDFGQLMGDVLGDLTNSPHPIEIKLFGDSVAVLEAKAKRVATLIEKVPGVVDIFDGVVISGPSFVVNVDAHHAALFGLTTQEIQDQLAAIMRGEVASTIQRGEKLIGIRVSYPDVYRYDFERIKRLRITNSDGVQVPLSNVASFEYTAGKSELDREGLRPVVAVSARIEGRDLGSTITEIKQLLGRSLKLPAGVTLQFGGIYQTQQQSFRGLLLAAVSAILMVFVVLLFEFGRFSVPTSILAVSLLSLLGVMAALWLTGTTFNISSFVGLIMIIGIVAENSVFIMHEAWILRATEPDPDVRLVIASKMRIRPIIMTTLAAVLALAPLAIGIGTGAQMLQPLAVAVIGGFCVSSLLLFFVLPVVYRLVDRK
ncbi:MAG TPA: efflux RND transporter permease subunit [candidate division Zixibacteria bacterium]|nr:efflux RND transporter permease subunit [candidate division Zixibacteria bacterium]